MIFSLCDCTCSSSSSSLTSRCGLGVGVWKSRSRILDGGDGRGAVANRAGSGEPPDARNGNNMIRLADI